MMEIIFTNPKYLLFLLIIPILIFIHFFSLKHTKKRALKFANFEAIERITGAQILSKNISLLYIRIFIVILIVFALSGMGLVYEGKTSNFDFVLAIDSSESMLADDIKPNRLEAAKDAAIQFIDSISTKTKIAVISFSGTSFINQELTDNLKKVKEAIRKIEIKKIGGTDIFEAIVTSGNLLKEGKNSKAIILLTDGQINVGTIDEIIKYANENNLIVHTIGVGTKKGGFFGSALSKIDENFLKALSYETGGKYFKVENKTELRNAYSEIASSNIGKITINFSIPLIIIAIILISFEFILVNTRYRIFP